MKRRVYMQGIAASLAGPLAACAGGSAAQPVRDQQPTPEPAPAKISFMIPGGPADEDYLHVFDAFRPKYPRITAEFVRAGTGYTQAYVDKLNTLISSGEGPDVFKPFDGTFGQYAHTGVFKQLDDYIKRSAAEVQLDDIYPAYQEASKYKGKIYSIVHNGAPFGVWMNVDLLQREGLSLPSWDWTWADMLKMAQVMTKRDATGRATQIGLARAPYPTWIWSAGGDVYSAGGTHMLIDQPPAIEALTWLQESVHRHRVSPTAEEQADQTLSLFEQGNVGMAATSRGPLARYRNVTNFTFDCVPLPRGPKGRLSELGVGYTSIWSGTKAPDAAFTFLSFFCGAEGQRAATSRGVAVPSRKSLVEEPWYKDYSAPRSASNKINTVFTDTLKRNEARARAPHPREADVFRSIVTNMNDLWSNAKPPRDVAQAIVAETSGMMTRP